MSSYSLSSLNGPPALALNSDFMAESGVVQLFGSFAASTGALVQNTANATTNAGFRGNWFTVSRIAAGQYRVQLVGLNLSTTLVPFVATASTNGQPNGLLMEPYAWLVSDGAAVANTSSTAGYQSVVGSTTTPNGIQLQCSRFDPGVQGATSATAQTFDIFAFTLAASTVSTAGAYQLSATLVDVPSTQRICFGLGYKTLAATP